MKIVTRSVSEGLPDFRSSEEYGWQRNSGKILRCAQNDGGLGAFPQQKLIKAVNAPRGLPPNGTRS